MRFASRGRPAECVGFRQALFSGLAPDGGLYHPADRPNLGPVIASMGGSTTFVELAARIIAELLGPEIEADRAAAIVRRAFPFQPELRPLGEHVSLLELFHGPTCAFKDFGASFMAAAMEELIQQEGRRIQILVATSGDTGGAVAHAFHRKKGIDVVILFPSGRVSALQERQLTTLGDNVRALEVRGSFDDCQRLVKDAFRDPVLKARLRLTSANSINVGRLIPQALYYIHAAVRHRALAGDSPAAAPPVFCVPSGNFGNLTAGVYAWHWGLPVGGFIAATNANDVVPQYLRTGLFSPRQSLATLSNAMDVGNPSNFERLLELFGGNHDLVKGMIEGRVVGDERTLATIRDVYQTHGVLVDPHTAVGVAACDPGRTTIVLSTAHPGKFADTVRTATGVEPELPERLARCLTLPTHADPMGTTLDELRRFLLDSFG